MGVSRRRGRRVAGWSEWISVLCRDGQPPGGCTERRDGHVRGDPSPGRRRAPPSRSPSTGRPCPRSGRRPDRRPGTVHAERDRRTRCERADAPRDRPSRAPSWCRLSRTRFDPQGFSGCRAESMMTEWSPTGVCHGTRRARARRAFRGRGVRRWRPVVPVCSSWCCRCTPTSRGRPAWLWRTCSPRSRTKWGGRQRLAGARDAVGEPGCLAPPRTSRRTHNRTRPPPGGPDARHP